MSKFLKLLTASLLLLNVSTVFADRLLMVRSTQSFTEAMTELQNALIARGYTITRVQRVDIGLTKNKYKTDKYRVVFYGKVKEVARISKLYPDFIPYLPLKIAIFAEGDETVVVATNPHEYARMYKLPGMRSYFARWTKDLRIVFKQLATAK